MWSVSGTVADCVLADCVLADCVLVGCVTGGFDTRSEFGNFGDGKLLPSLFSGLIDQGFDRLMTA